MMQKRIAGILIAVLCLSMAGCGMSDDTAKDAETTVPTEETQEVEVQMEETKETEIQEEEIEEAEIPEEETEEEEEKEEEAEEPVFSSDLPGAQCNGDQFARGEDPLRVTYADGFYYEPISNALKDYITGTSYPETDDESSLAITVDSLRYVHVLYCDFDGANAEGELICNASIAQDLVEIFSELYENAYPIEQIHLVDEYGGDDEASMAADNTSCFNYRVVAGSSHLSQHAYGLAVDVNTLYNPYITYNSDGSINVAPENAWDYADRSADFPHKIDTQDLCYQLFTAHGFTWGGSWNSSRDYQHFEK